MKRKPKSKYILLNYFDDGDIYRSETRVFRSKKDVTKHIKSHGLDRKSKIFRLFEENPQLLVCWDNEPDEV